MCVCVCVCVCVHVCVCVCACVCLSVRAPCEYTACMNGRASSVKCSHFDTRHDLITWCSIVACHDTLEKYSYTVLTSAMSVSAT